MKEVGKKLNRCQNHSIFNVTMKASLIENTSKKFHGKIKSSRYRNHSMRFSILRDGRRANGKIVKEVRKKLNRCQNHSIFNVTMKASLIENTSKKFHEEIKSRYRNHSFSILYGRRANRKMVKEVKKKLNRCKNHSTIKLGLIGNTRKKFHEETKR